MSIANIMPKANEKAALNDNDNKAKKRKMEVISQNFKATPTIR